MGYQTEKLASGALKVLDVPLMGPQKLTEKHFKVKDINEKWMSKAIETFAEQKKLGKLPLLWDAHNERDKAAGVIGRLDNLRVEQLDGEPWLYADVIITDELHKQKFLEGKSPSKSVEFQPDNYYMRGLALLDGHEGHFDFGIADFVPEGLYEELEALSLDPKCTVLCYSKSNNATGAPMDFSLEDVKAAVTEIIAPIDQRLSAIEQKVGMGGDQPPSDNNPPAPPQAPQGSQNMSKDIDETLDAIRNEERDRYNAEIANVKRQAKIDLYTMTLSAKTGTPEKLVRKQLESFKSEEAMDLYVKNAQEKKVEDVKLGIEREHGENPDLREEYDNYVKRFKQAHGFEPSSTFDDYVRCSDNAMNLTNMSKRSGRPVVKVSGNVNSPAAFE